MMTELSWGLDLMQLEFVALKNNFFAITGGIFYKNHEPDLII